MSAKKILKVEIFTTYANRSCLMQGSKDSMEPIEIQNTLSSLSLGAKLAPKLVLSTVIHNNNKFTHSHQLSRPKLSILKNLSHHSYPHTVSPV
jgi:hypothetical protein